MPRESHLVQMGGTMKLLQGRFTYANVTATLALFIAIGGASAFAASQLAKNSVGAKQLKKNAVTKAKVKNSAITKAKIADGAVTGAKVLDGSLTGADINQGTLTGVRASNVTAISITDDANCSAARPLPAGVTTERPLEGRCKITLPASLENCAMTATVTFHPKMVFGVGPRT